MIELGEDGPDSVGVEFAHDLLPSLRVGSELQTKDHSALADTSEKLRVATTNFIETRAQGGGYTINIRNDFRTQRDLERLERGYTAQLRTAKGGDMAPAVFGKPATRSFLGAVC